ncbi:unnamed protein product, partial [Prunus brigantina]
TDWRCLWETRLTINPYLFFHLTMNPPSALLTDGPTLGLASGANPAVPPGTPRVERPGRQGTLEDKMEVLQREMVKMQEHNNELAPGRPSAPQRLFVPSSEEGQRERQASPIPVQARLNDQHLDVLGPKSPIRQRYDAIGLEEIDESDYVSTIP